MTCHARLGMPCGPRKQAGASNFNSKESSWLLLVYIHQSEPKTKSLTEQPTHAPASTVHERWHDGHDVMTLGSRTRVQQEQKETFPRIKNLFDIYATRCMHFLHRVNFYPLSLRLNPKFPPFSVTSDVTHDHVE